MLWVGQSSSTQAATNLQENIQHKVSTVLLAGDTGEPLFTPS